MSMKKWLATALACSALLTACGGQGQNQSQGQASASGVRKAARRFTVLP